MTSVWKECDSLLPQRLVGHFGGSLEDRNSDRKVDHADHTHLVSEGNGTSLGTGLEPIHVTFCPK